MKYENNDASFQSMIGIVAIIIYNVLNHLGLIQIIFGSATNETIIQSITVLLMVVMTWILTRRNRKKRKLQPKEIDNKEIIKEIKEVKKNIGISSFFTSLNNTHFHYPIIQI